LNPRATERNVYKDKDLISQGKGGGQHKGEGILYSREKDGGAKRRGLFFHNNIRIGWKWEGCREERERLVHDKKLRRADLRGYGQRGRGTQKSFSLPKKKKERERKGPYHSE